MNSQEDRTIWRDELRERLNNVSSETVRRWMKEGRLPKPDVELSKRSMGWRLSTLHAAGIKI